jgi:hypothetical protein
MNSLKCAGCGLINFATAGECKRCGAALFGRGDVLADGEDAGGAGRGSRRGPLRKVLAGCGLSFFLLVGCYVSLLETSEPATFDQRQLVYRAVDLIEQGGFARDAFLLRRLANYRTTDNWWNRWLGHGEAYAATNFPFEVVTLYPEFFKYATDDVERAVILLHEARYLAGQGEEEAFAGVWRDKARLGWTREKYGQTRVWKNVREFTPKYAPELFLCGEDGRQDCAE